MTQADKEVLNITDILPNISENGTRHHTDRYELMRRAEPFLVVRRGEGFVIDLELSRNYDPNVDRLDLLLLLKGVGKALPEGSFVKMPIVDGDTSTDNSWKVSIVDIGNLSLRIEIVPSSEALIGKWKLGIETSNGSENSLCVMDHPFYLIFNPFCPDDTVYLNDDNEREEYVMNEQGLIWRNGPTNWSFDQFQENILDCSFWVLFNVGKLEPSDRNNPVIISRVLSAVINVQDDNGVLVGNWADEFKDGRAPTEWTGSRAILHQFYNTEKPVRYGQCWVFGGVLTTVCRCLGIPSRVVTNFESGHDSDRSLTIDTVYGKDGKKIGHLSDSVWNFHVWSEVWMTRPDLSKEYDGWQLVDATPQEESHGIYCCGPTSVAAIKSGQVDLPYDGGFVFAEVNGDEVYWVLDENEQEEHKQRKIIGNNTNRVGQYISTKAVGKWEREDITHTYKDPERTPEERATMMKALTQSHQKFVNYYINEDFNDVIFDVNFDSIQQKMVGESFRISVSMKNWSLIKSYDVSVLLDVNVVSHKGQIKHAVKTVTSDEYVEPRQSNEVQSEITWADYGSILENHSAFIITCFATIKDIDYHYVVEKKYNLTRPTINFEVTGKTQVGKKLGVLAKFTNPLPVAIESGSFQIQIPEMSPLEMSLVNPANPGEDVICDFKFVPKVRGNTSIAAKFCSESVTDIEGFHSFEVKKKKLGLFNLFS